MGGYDDDDGESMNEPDGQGLHHVYANWLRSLAGPYELALDLGYRIGEQPPTPDVRVVVSWEYAVVIRDALNNAIEGYEGASGEEIRALGGNQFGPAEFDPGR